MGTKVQCKNYQLGFYSNRDLNEANSVWPLYYEDEAMSRQLCGASKLRHINDTEYDKGVLRETILKHEATFRKQVQELHHLYRVQQKLMDELKRKEQYDYSLQEHTALSIPFSSQTPQKDLTRKLTCYSSFVNGADGDVSVPKARIDAKNDSELSKSGSRKGPRILIDLQLPPEAYSDNEVPESTIQDCTDRTKKLLDLNGDPEPECGTKSMLTNDESFACKKSRKLDLQFQNNTCSLVDLNEPIEGVCCHETRDSSFSNPRDSSSFHENTPDHSSRKENTLFKPQILFQNNPFEISNTGHKHVKEREETKELQFSSNQWDHSQFGKNIYMPHSLSSRRISSSSVKYQHDLSSSSFSSRNNSASWLQGNLSIGKEHGKLPACKNSRLSASTSSTIPRFDNCDVTSASDIFCKKSENKISNIPISVQTPTYFSNSFAYNEGSGSAHDKSRYCGDLRSQQNSGNEVSYKNGVPHDYQSDYRASNLHSQEAGLHISNISDCEVLYHGKFVGNEIQKHSKGLNLMDMMSAKDITSTNVSEDECGTKSHFNGSVGTVPRGISWLKPTQVQNGSININGCMRYTIDSAPSYSQSVSRNPLISGNDEATNYSFNETLHSKIEVEHGLPNNKKHAGLSIIDLNSNYNQTAQNMSSEENPANRVQIDINSATCMDQQPALSVVSVENEPRAQTKFPITAVSRNSTFEIDLEAPIIIYSEENQRETLHSDRSFKICETQSRTEIGMESKLLYSETSRMAAETILSLSTKTLRKSSNFITSFSGLASDDTLYWFADTITSIVDDSQAADCTLEGKRDEDKSSDHDGMDFFESMTLRLTETKAEDFWTQPVIPENQEEGPGAASLLLPKFKRGQVRRRRQKRDFQKDILPSLATLSRYEVSEDLQTIGGLMKASGQNWQMGSGKRNAGRNGRSRGRGRRAQIGTREVEISVDSSHLQPKNNDFENDATITGWGRTRRCRRQRYPSGNAPMHPPLS